MNAKIYVTVKVGDNQQSFELTPNKEGKPTDKFARLGMPNEHLLTSSQGLYVSHKLIEAISKAKAAAKKASK